MAATEETVYRHVRVRRMNDDGGSSLVYPNTVTVATVYDPKVLLIFCLYFEAEGHASVLFIPPIVYTVC